MTRMQKTIHKSQDALRQAGEAAATESRETAASFVRRAGGGIRRQSHRAAQAAERAGDRLGSALEHSAKRIQPDRSFLGRLGDYFARHPIRMLLLFGLMTGVVAVIAVQILGNRQSEDEFNGFY